jgi:hypothetical protein
MEELQTQEILNKIEMMKQIIIGFTEVINRENNALKINDVQSIKVLYEQKLKTVAAYRSMSAFFIKNREILASFECEAKNELKDLSSILDQTLKTNELLLKTRMEAGKRVMDTFINIAKTANKSNATSYGARGNYTPLDNNRNALAFNRTL